MATRLFTPGPTNIPDDVRAALARPSIHHRTAQFLALAKSVHGSLERLMDANAGVIVLASSGTGGLEAIMANMLQPGETVLAVISGKFGERWRELAAVYGNQCIELNKPWGDTAAPAELDAMLSANPGVRAVLLTQVETSTGTVADIQGLAAVARKHGALVAVDAISGLGIHDLPLKAWDLDAIVGSTQKALMLPPGAAILALSPRAWEAAKANPRPRYYFDLRPYEKLAPGDSPFTPPVGLYMGLEASMARIEAEGFVAFRVRHARLAAATRAGCVALGLRLFSLAPCDLVTALYAPDGVSGREFLKPLEAEYGMRIALGQGKFKESMIRIAHMGDASEADIFAILAALGAIMERKGLAPRAAAGVEAALASFAKPALQEARS